MLAYNLIPKTKIMNREDELIEEVKNMPVETTGEPVDQLLPEEDDADEENEEFAGDEPYEGIREENDEDDDLVDDNMSGMPVIPSPS